MKLTILGYWGGTPHQGRGTSAYLIEAQGERLLLDFGSGAMAQLSTICPLTAINYGILSHWHFDHMADLGIFQYGLTRLKRLGQLPHPIPLFMPSEPASLKANYLDPVVSPIDIDPSQSYQEGPFVINFFSVQHTIPCYAVRIQAGEKTLVYSADSQYFSALADFARDCDLFLCETTVVQGSNHTSGKGHMDGYQAGSLAQKAQAKNLILTHLPNDGDLNRIKTEASQAYSGPIHLASDLIIFEL